MAAKKVEVTTEVRLGDVVLNPIVPQAPVPDVVPAKMSFAMFMAVRQVPVREQAGMRAFTSIQQATFAEWTTIFSAY